MTASGADDNFLKDYLRDILSFMRSSADSYDKELHGEARRLAACLKALLHDTKDSSSLLTRLGLKSLQFFDFSPDYNPDLDLPFSGVAIVTIGTKHLRYVPRLGNDERIGYKPVSFEAWWHKPVIVDPGRNINMSRESVVLEVAASNTGIVNSKLAGTFDNIVAKSAQAGISLTPVVNTDITPIEHASLRHIAFELLESLHAQAPEYF